MDNDQDFTEIDERNANTIADLFRQRPDIPELSPGQLDLVLVAMRHV